MQEMDNNKSLIKALTSKIDTLTNHIEQLQAAPSASSASAAGNEAKGANAEPKVPFPDRAISLELASDSSAIVPDTVSPAEGIDAESRSRSKVSTDSILSAHICCSFSATS